MLARYTRTHNVAGLVREQFAAKSAPLAALSARALCAGDLKKFTLPGGMGLGFSVVETPEAAALLARTPEIVKELATLKPELFPPATEGDDNDGERMHDQEDALFFGIVDILNLETHVVVAGKRERVLAKAAGFDAQPLAAETRQLAGELGAAALFRMAPGIVSRKKEFVPPLFVAIADELMARNSDTVT